MNGAIAAEWITWLFVFFLFLAIVTGCSHREHKQYDYIIGETR